MAVMDEAAFASRIGKGTKISGKLNFKAPAKIEGEAEGEITGDEVMIAAGGPPRGAGRPVPGLPAGGGAVPPPAAPHLRRAPAGALEPTRVRRAGGGPVPSRSSR